MLHADEVPRQQEVQNLPAAVAQGLEAVAPALQKRVQAGVGLAFMDQGVAFLQHEFAPLEVLHQRQLFFAVRNEQRQGARTYRHKKTQAPGRLLVAPLRDSTMIYVTLTTAPRFYSVE